jgi:hypothetical protein
MLISSYSRSSFTPRELDHLPQLLSRRLWRCFQVPLAHQLEDLILLCGDHSAGIDAPVGIALERHQHVPLDLPAGGI